MAGNVKVGAFDCRLIDAQHDCSLKERFAAMSSRNQVLEMFEPGK
jgi:hypothetical protein